MKRICCDCNYFIPLFWDQPTEYGICINDKEFEPYLEKILENENWEACKELVEKKKFLGDKSACPDFEECELIELDENSSLVQELSRLAQEGELTRKNSEIALIKELITKIDWQYVPVEEFVKRLRSKKPAKRDSAIEDLGLLISFQNRAALDSLLDYLESLGPPKDVKDVDLRLAILGQFRAWANKSDLVPFLVKELRDVKPTDTTRAWISALLDFLEGCPFEAVWKPLGELQKRKDLDPWFKERLSQVYSKVQRQGSGGGQAGPRPRKKKFQKVYQFKVTLDGIKPPIWRRIQVPDNYTFWDLHVAIQDAMGWWDCHLHEFRIVNPFNGRTERIGIPDEEGWGPPAVPGWKRDIAFYFSEVNSKAKYVYDFGDEWSHTVRLEKILEREPGVKYPVCVGGKRACPPENCGGVAGYEQLLEIIMDPSHEEYESMNQWLGEDFDPEMFDPQEVEFDDPKKRWKDAFQES